MNQSNESIIVSADLFIVCLLSISKYTDEYLNNIQIIDNNRFGINRAFQFFANDETGLLYLLYHHTSTVNSSSVIYLRNPSYLQEKKHHFENIFLAQLL